MFTRFLLFAVTAVAVALPVVATSGASTDDRAVGSAATQRNLKVPSGLAVSCDKAPSNLPAFLARNARQNLKGDNQKIAWGWYPWAMSMLNFWEMTGDRRYLDHFVKQYDSIVARRDSVRGRRDQVRGRVLKAWGFDRDGTTPYSTTTGETGLIAHAGLRFAELRPAGYGKAADRYLRVGRDAVNEFTNEFRFYGRGGYYHDPYRNLAEPTNHQHALGLALLVLYRMEGTHKREIRGMARGFRRSMWGRQGAWMWTYRLVRKPNPEKVAERTGKATTTLRFPLDAWRSGIAFNRKEVRRLAKTFRVHVDTRRGLNFVIDRNSFRPLRSHVDFPKVLRFAEMDAVDRRIGNRLVRLMRSHCRRWKQGWFSNKHTVYALSELMLNRGGYRKRP